MNIGPGRCGEVRAGFGVAAKIGSLFMVDVKNLHIQRRADVSGIVDNMIIFNMIREIQAVRLCNWDHDGNYLKHKS